MISSSFIYIIKLLHRASGEYLSKENHYRSSIWCPLGCYHISSRSAYCYRAN